MTAPLGGLTGPFWTTLIGAVVGATVGKLITFAIQVNAVRITRNEREAARREGDLAAAYVTMVKLAKILSTFHKVAEIMRGRSRKIGNARGSRTPTCGGSPHP